MPRISPNGHLHTYLTFGDYFAPKNKLFLCFYLQKCHFLSKSANSHILNTTGDRFLVRSGTTQESGAGDWTGPVGQSHGTSHFKHFILQ